MIQVMVTASIRTASSYSTGILVDGCASEQMLDSKRAIMDIHTTLIGNPMKKLLCMLTLLLAGAASAQAQVLFESGSSRPINPGAATDQAVRQAGVRPTVKKRAKLYRCRDGSKRTYRQCSRHGGIRR